MIVPPVPFVPVVLFVPFVPVVLFVPPVPFLCVVVNHTRICSRLTPLTAET